MKTKQVVESDPMVDLLVDVMDLISSKGLCGQVKTDDKQTPTTTRYTFCFRPLRKDYVGGCERHGTPRDEATPQQLAVDVERRKLSIKP